MLSKSQCSYSLSTSTIIVNSLTVLKKNVALSYLLEAILRYHGQKCYKESLASGEINFPPSKKIYRQCLNDRIEQECIPVGCVPPAAVNVCWGRSASVHVGIHPPRTWTPKVWVWRPTNQTLNPHWVLAWRPPLTRPLNLPLGEGLETPPTLNLPPGCVAGTSFKAFHFMLDSLSRMNDKDKQQVCGNFRK